MTIDIACACGAKILVESAEVGVGVTCFRCRSVTPVPASRVAIAGGVLAVGPSSPSTRTCPHCSETIRSDSTYCRYCKLQVSGIAPNGGKVCPSCGGHNGVTAIRCGTCDAYFPAPGAEGVPMAQMAVRTAEERLGIEAIPKPWDLYVVFAIMGLDILAGLASVFAGQSNAGGLGGVVFTCVIFYGLTQRRNWAYWWSVVGKSLGIVILLIVASMVDSIPNMPEGAETLCYIAAAVNFVIVALLVVCRARGAYFHEVEV